MGEKLTKAFEWFDKAAKKRIRRKSGLYQIFGTGFEIGATRFGGW